MPVSTDLPTLAAPAQAQAQAQAVPRTLSATLDAPPPDSMAPEYARGVALGRYLVLDRLGAGGMGVVYAAWDPELDRKVAIKLLHARVDPALGESPLLREARAMARLTHPNVLAVHDVGTLDGQVFVATEFIDGVTLREWLQTPRARRDVLAILLAAGAGLAAAHAAGMVHRDFKPENVMVARDGRVRVMDFGLARPLAAATAPAPSGSGLYRTLAIAGTPAYMAPEQWEGRPQDAHADIFAFCVVAWEALTGDHPFAGPTLVATGEAIVRGRVRPLPPGVRLPRRLHQALLRGLRADPAARHPALAGLLAELQHDPKARLMRAASITVITAAVLALGYAGWLVTRPGTVAVRVHGDRAPLAPTAVHVGPHALAITDNLAVGDVPVGTWRVTVSAADHVPRDTIVEVERGREVHLDVSLDHERGQLDLEVENHGATVFVDGVDHGGRLRGLAVATGSHELRVQSPGHYERRLTWTVAADQTRAGYVSLPPALLWSHRETGVGHDDTPLGDLDGDGRRELLHRNFSTITVIDPHRDRTLWRAANAQLRDVAHWVDDFDGDARPDLIVADDRVKDGWHLGLWPAASLASADTPPRWTRPGTRGRGRRDRQRGVTLDLDGDGARDLVTAILTPDSVAAYAGPTGETLWQTAVGGPPEAILHDRDRILVVTDARRLALDARTGAALWSAPAAHTPVQSAELIARDAAAPRDLVIAIHNPDTSVDLEARAGADGSLLWTFHHAPGKYEPRVATADGAVLLLHGPTTHHHDGRTGALVWQLPGHLATLRQADGSWLVTAGVPPGLVAYHLADATPAFTRDLGGPAVAPPVLFDWDADGTHELTVAGPDHTLHMFDPAGVHEAAVYLPGSSPEQLTPLGDLDRDGVPDLAVRGLGGPAIVRGARVLWARRGQDAVRAAPVIADLDHDGKLEVVIAGVFGPRGIHIFDAATGAVRLPGRRGSADIIRAPLLVPRADGGFDIVAHILGDRLSLYRYDGRTGARTDATAAVAPGYASPTLADLDRDGDDELLLTPWFPGEFAALDPTTLATEWTVTLPDGSWNAPTVARTAETTHLVFQLLRGDLLVVDVAARTTAWSRQFGATQFAAPTVVDLDGDRTPEIVTSTVDAPGDLVCLRLADGGEVWRLPGLAGRSAPVVAHDLDGDGRPELLHASERAGVLALDATGATLWQWLPRPHQPVQPRPDAGGLVTDLDGDGAPELVTAFRDGVVYVLDARTGAHRWQFHTGEERVEAPPVAADVDGDGRQELFIGAQDHTLYALRTAAAP